MAFYKGHSISLDGEGVLFCSEFELRANSFDEMKKLIDDYMKSQKEANKADVFYLDNDWKTDLPKIIAATTGALHTSGDIWVINKSNGGRKTMSISDLYIDDKRNREIAKQHIETVKRSQQILKQADKLLDTMKRYQVKK